LHTQNKTVSTSRSKWRTIRTGVDLLISQSELILTQSRWDRKKNHNPSRYPIKARQGLYHSADGSDVSTWFWPWPWKENSWDWPRIL